MQSMTSAVFTPRPESRQRRPLPNHAVNSFVQCDMPMLRTCSPWMCSTSCREDVRWGCCSLFKLQSWGSEVLDSRCSADDISDVLLCPISKPLFVSKTKDVSKECPNHRASTMHLCP